MTRPTLAKGRAQMIGAAILGLVFAMNAPAHAADNDVLQIKQSFEPNTLDVAVGASVNFVNDDDVTHNLQTIAPDGAKTDHGLEKPGETTAISFPTAGVYSVICKIHPRMKMKVTAG